MNGGECCQIPFVHLWDDHIISLNFSIKTIDYINGFSDIETIYIYFLHI